MAHYTSSNLCGGVGTPPRAYEEGGVPTLRDIHPNGVANTW